MIHTVVQMVRVVGLTNGPGFSVLGGWGVFVLWFVGLHSLQKCYIDLYER